MFQIQITTAQGAMAQESSRLGDQGLQRASFATALAIWEAEGNPHT